MTLKSIVIATIIIAVVAGSIVNEDIEHISNVEIKYTKRLSDILVDKMQNRNADKSIDIKSVQGKLLQSESEESGEVSTDCMDHCLQCFDYTECKVCEAGYELTDTELCLEKSDDDDWVDEPETSAGKSGHGFAWLLWIIVIALCFGGCLYGIGKLKQRRDAQEYRAHNDHEKKMFELTGNDQVQSPRQHDFKMPKITVSPPMEGHRELPAPYRRVHESEFQSPQASALVSREDEGMNIGKPVI